MHFNMLNDTVNHKSNNVYIFEGEKKKKIQKFLKLLLLYFKKYHI